MGLLDWPAPAFDTFDSLMADAIGPFGRVLVWALICAVISMLLYKAMSPQTRIKAIKERLKEARLAMANDDGEDFAEGMKLAKAQLVQSLKLVGFVIGPAVAASLPALALIIWLDGQYSYSCPVPGQHVSISVQPENAAIEQVGINPVGFHDGACPVVQVPGTTDSQTYLVAPTAAIPVIQQRQWWNFVIGNPAGYLPDDGPVTQLRFDLPTQQIINVGPDWARGWELTFFLALVLGSLAIKKGFRIE
tara:strand:+ start:69394 stop:70137 length:744 start_codon:yes stop_codon:yes gene_type:complete